MAYIGNIPAEKYSAFQKQDFTTSATTSYTLDNPVANANELALFINFVRQEPTTAYSASGTSLTLTSATSSSDDMYCVYLGKAVQTVNPPNASVGSSQVSADLITGQTALASEPADTDEFLVSDAGTLKRIDYSLIKGGGITVADSWRLTADITNTDADITANLERDDTAGAGYIGSAMTVSSGIFTFPSTGVYQIVMYANWNVTNENISLLQMFTTINNSSYTQRADINASTTGGAHYKNSSASVFFDVTDTSQCKLKFATDSMNSSCILRGSSTKNETHFTFVRLGDT